MNNSSSVFVEKKSSIELFFAQTLTKWQCSNFPLKVVLSQSLFLAPLKYSHSSTYDEKYDVVTPSVFF